ncbi:MAG: aminotransferase class I/II-fold pyridoxal phosphate-dependent enzyme [Anaerolineae bacterium]|nr:aminotransferase class I/II-fold pyridoxal phosphate-dependent enzyme [Anaerolineae bacterium]
MKNVLAQRVVSVPPSGIRKFFDIAATMKDVISLGIGEPDFVTPPAITEAGIRSLQQGETHYTSNSGILELRQAISDNVARLYGVRYDAESEVLVTVGVSEALHLAMSALIDPGDEVIIPTPCFVAYVPAVVFAGGMPVTLCTTMENGFQTSAADIAKAITPRTKAILLGYPNNPTGAVMSRDRLLEIARLVEERDLLVISDEIYDRLVYGVEHTCFASLPGMRDRTVILQGFSKAYAMTGWRLGYAVGPAEVIAGMRKMHQYIIMSAPTPAQYAALEALRSGEPEVQRMRAEYDRRRKVVVAGLNAMGLTCCEPKGAFYAFPSIRASGMTSDEFANRLLEEEHVALIPGTAFGACGEGFVRISYATSLEKIEEALERMRRFMERHG